jgi:hypothetical protein
MHNLLFQFLKMYVKFHRRNTDPIKMLIHLIRGKLISRFDVKEQKSSRVYDFENCSLPVLYHVGGGKNHTR